MGKVLIGVFQTLLNGKSLQVVFLKLLPLLGCTLEIALLLVVGIEQPVLTENISK